jgi:cell division septation protein DedD
MSDESLREFQLNGKQLVFLFMASTIVAVVIFLCGVMVGRGVGLAQTNVVTNSTVETGDPTAGAVPELSASAPAVDPTDVAPDAPGDEPTLKYPDVLTEARPKNDLEPAKAAPPKAPAPRAAAPPRPTAVASAKPPTPAAPAPAPVARAATGQDVEPTGQGFVVQVIATPQRGEAEAVRSRLQQKGYPAFITSAGNMFRVRVGKYQDRAQADTVSKRLETEERFKPWVTR